MQKDLLPKKKCIRVFNSKNGREKNYGHTKLSEGAQIFISNYLDSEIFLFNPFFRLTNYYLFILFT